MNRILIFGLYAFGCICAYADTAEYLKKNKRFSKNSGRDATKARFGFRFKCAKLEIG